MADKIGPKELRQRELAQQTRVGKNRRAKVIDALKAEIAKVPAKKTKHKSNKGKRR